MKIKSILALLFVAALFVVSSCKKEEAGLQNTEINSNTNIKSVRLNTNMTNEEMEAEIKGFIEKLENPKEQPDMNYKEAFENVEATLNYKYVNYDYSKCANTKEFNDSINISPDANDMMSMTAIKAAYTSILNDWHNKYYSISDDIKTPIVFDITDVTPTSVKYTMDVGYGYLDLSTWGKDFVAAASTYYVTAAHHYTFQLYAHLHNNQIQWNPSGTRTYAWSVVPTYYIDPTDYPSNPSMASVNPEPLPPLGNGYTDYKLFKSDQDLPGYHLYLNTKEYNYHWHMLSVILMDLLNRNSNANFVVLAEVEAYGLNPYFPHVKHYMKVRLGYRYWTVEPISTL